jgi:hypothetical protein
VELKAFRRIFAGLVLQTRWAMKKYLAVLVVLLMFGMGSTQAQDQSAATADSSGAAASSDTDQNAPEVARLSYINGSVSMQRGDNSQWTAVTVNTPVMAGDRVSTGDNSRAELQLDYANVIRLSSNTTVKVASLNKGNVQVQVGQGLATYSVLDGAQSAAEVDTPNAAVHPNGPGDYRIIVDSDSESIVTVRRGSADVSTPQGSTHVNDGQMITVQGTNSPQYRIDAAPARDDWDSWNDDRNRIMTRAEESNNTNRYEVGTQDLDAYGQWENVPDYGQVWVPAQGSDWAPYRDGRWVWEPYWGWTWVSYEPWGWAPYHYGRWFVYDGDWCWWPGPVYAGYYPIWAPAYVSFFGWGGGWGFGFGWGWGWGHIGWLPCGPGDWYHPWWGRWGGRVNVVGFDRINGLHEGWAPLGRRNGIRYSNFDNASRNNRIRSGLSYMDGSRFGREAVPRHETPISTARLRSVSFSAGRMPVTPGRGSYSPINRAPNPSSYRHAPSSTQHFFTASRGNFGHNSVAARGGFNSTTRPTSTARPENGFSANRGARSFERPSSGANARSNGMMNGSARAPVTSLRPGWHTFTPPGSGNALGSRGFTPNSGARFNNSNRGFNNANRGLNPPARQSQPSRNTGGWQHFNSNSASRGFSPDPRGDSNGRPALNMRQPIVRPRNNGYGAYGSRGYSRPSYSQPRYYSAPRSYSAPRYSAPRSYSRPSYSAPRGSSGGGGRSYRGGGGGGSRGGGGGGFHGGGGGHPSGGSRGGGGRGRG